MGPASSSAKESPQSTSTLVAAYQANHDIANMSDDQFRDSLDALLGGAAFPRDEAQLAEVDATLLGGLPPLEVLTGTSSTVDRERSGMAQFQYTGFPAAEVETNAVTCSSVSESHLSDSQPLSSIAGPQVMMDTTKRQGVGNMDTMPVQANISSTSTTFIAPAVGENPRPAFQQPQHHGSIEATLQQIRLIESYSNLCATQAKSTSETGTASGSTAVKGRATRKRSLQHTRQLSVASDDGQRAAAAAPPAISEDEVEARKRRSDRNAREQARSQKIADQIADLHELLDEAAIQHKPDKYHTLVCTANYIRKLQQQSAELQRKHEEMARTLQQISHQLNQHYTSGSALSCAAPTVVSSGSVSCFSGSECVSPMELTREGGAGSNQTSEFPEGRIDFKWVFDCAPFASSVTSIDGRFLECNAHFELLSGYSRQELLEIPNGKSRNMSLFNILHRQHIERIFAPLSEMLQYNEETREHPSSKQRQNVSETVVLGCSDAPHKRVRRMFSGWMVVSTVFSADVFADMLLSRCIVLSVQLAGESSYHTYPLPSRSPTFLQLRVNSCRG